jgi:hypothetical protein
MYTKTYYWILVVLNLAGFSVATNEWVGNGKISVLDIVNNISIVIFFVGVAGYVYKKAILNELFWRVFFVIDIIISLWFLYVSKEIATAHITPSSIGLIVGILFTIPALFFLYSYAFKSADVWNKKPMK